MFNLVPAFNLRPFDGISSFVLKKELIDDQKKTNARNSAQDGAIRTFNFFWL